MQIFNRGFTWHFQPPKDSEPAPSRAKALAALASVSPLGQRSKAFRQGWAAYETGDYGRAVACADYADDFAEAWEQGCRS